MNNLLKIFNVIHTSTSTLILTVLKKKRKASKLWWEEKHGNLLVFKQGFNRDIKMKMGKYQRKYNSLVR